MDSRRLRRGHQSISRVGKDDSGATAVEFGLIAPVLLLMLAAIVDFGLTLNNYLELTDAVRVGARQFAIAGQTATPMSTSTAAVQSAAANLNAANITISYQVNGAACTTDTGCQTALAAGAGQSATVTATYPCNAPMAGITILSSCTLSSTTTEMIE